MNEFTLYKLIRNERNDNMQCLDIVEIRDYLFGFLSEEDRKLAEAHFSNCDKCRNVMVSVYESFDDEELSEWECASEEEVKAIFDDLDTAAPSVFDVVFVWIVKTITPDSQNNVFSSGNYSLSPVRRKPIDGAPLTETTRTVYLDFDIYSLMMGFEKIEEDKMNVQISILKSNEKKNDVRITLTNDRKEIFSDLSENGKVFFEEIPLGNYRLMVVDEEAVFGPFDFSIDQKGISGKELRS